MSDIAEIKVDGKTVELPVITGTEDEKAILIQCYQGVAHLSHSLALFHERYEAEQTAKLTAAERINRTYAGIVQQAKRMGLVG